MKTLSGFWKNWEKLWEYLSDPELIVFGRKVRRLLVFSLILFSVLVCFRINYSSIGQWKDAAPGKGDKDESLLLGTPRGIRSDEWCVVTPFMLAQANHSPSFPAENENLGSGKVPLLMSLPVKHFSTVFRPQNWGFFLFGFERGYSFYWNMKVFGLLLSFFLLLMLLTRNRFWLSLFGSLWLFFSSFMQWWFSAPPMPPEMIASASLAFLGIVYLFFSSKRKLVPLGALVLLFASVNFALFFYPPFQIPLGYLFAFLFIGYLAKNFRKENLRKFLKLKIIFLILFVAVFSLVIGKFYLDARETIQIVRSTSYPGVRVLTGGEMSVAKMFSGFFFMFMGEKNYPAFLGVVENICETSSFVLFFPLLLVLLIWNWLRVCPESPYSAANSENRLQIFQNSSKYFRYFSSFFKIFARFLKFSRRKRNFGQTLKKTDFVQLSLGLYAIFISSWMLFGFPKAVAKVTFLNLVSASRSLIGLGAASIIWTVAYLGAKNDENRDAGKSFFHFANLALFAIFLGLMVWYGFALRKATDNFFAAWQVWVVGLWVATLALLTLRKKTVWFFALLIPLLLFANAGVNPVVAGLNSIRGKDIYKFAREKKKENPDARWIFFGKLPVDNILEAAGVNIINGTKYSPDLPLMEKLDPEKKFVSVYNRYAYVKFYSSSDKETISFNLEKTDKYSVSADPCSRAIKDIGVDFAAIQGDVKKYNLDCLDPVSENSLNRTRIFKYK